MTRILKDNTKQTRLSKRAHNAGDVEHITMLQDVGPKRLVVILVIKRVTYPHAVKMSKTSEKQPKPGKAQEKAKAKGKVKVITEQIRLIRIKPVNSVRRFTKVGNRARN